MRICLLLGDCCHIRRLRLFVVMVHARLSLLLASRMLHNLDHLVVGHLINRGCMELDWTTNPTACKLLWRLGLLNIHTLLQCVQMVTVHLEVLSAVWVQLGLRLADGCVVVLRNANQLGLGRDYLLLLRLVWLDR